MENQIEVFSSKDKHSSERFAKWLNGNTGAFFINYKSPTDMMIHKVPCGHFIFREVVNLTANEKVCSPKYEKLESWANQHGAKKLKVCSNCKP